MFSIRTYGECGSDFQMILHFAMEAIMGAISQGGFIRGLT